MSFAWAGIAIEILGMQMLWREAVRRQPRRLCRWESPSNNNKCEGQEQRYRSNHRPMDTPGRRNNECVGCGWTEMEHLCFVPFIYQHTHSFIRFAILQRVKIDPPLGVNIAMICDDKRSLRPQEERRFHYSSNTSHAFLRTGIFTCEEEFQDHGPANSNTQVATP